MSKKVSKYGILVAVATALLILVLLNICTFAIPFQKVNLGILFVAYGCTEFVILFEMTVVIFQLFLEDNAKKKILGLPIFFFAIATTIFQILCTITVYIINAYISMPIWLLIIIECIIIGLGIIQIFKGLFFKERSEIYQESMANTDFMDEFRARITSLYNLNTKKGIEKELRDLLDISLTSDPVTNEKTIDSENELFSLLQELDNAIKNESEDKAMEVIAQVKTTLLERNELCKIGKK